MAKCPLLKSFIVSGDLKRARFEDCVKLECAWYTKAKGCSIRILAEIELSELAKEI